MDQSRARAECALADGQVDNCPGNGASAWAWLYVPNAGNAATGILTYADMYITYSNPSGQTQTFDLSHSAGGTTTYDFYGGTPSRRYLSAKPLYTVFVLFTPSI
jgi:hypothetical protein